jgi:hypothetical protein
VVQVRGAALSSGSLVELVIARHHRLGRSTSALWLR